MPLVGERLTCMTEMCPNATSAWTKLMQRIRIPPSTGKSGKIAPDIMVSYTTEEEDLSTSPLLDMSCCRGSQTIGGGLALLSSSSSAHRSRSPASVFTSIFQFLIDVVHLNMMIFYSEPLNMFSFLNMFLFLNYFYWFFIFQLILTSTYSFSC
jgi:hypothetical protein